MYLLGLGLLVLSSWYLFKLYENFKRDTTANAEVGQALKKIKEEVSNKNPFFPGRIKEAINKYKEDMRTNK